MREDRHHHGTNHEVHEGHELGPGLFVEFVQFVVRGAIA